MFKYVHYNLNEEITAIGGHYVISKELKIPVDDKAVLVTIGFGVMDTTCCGTGGCAYATVHGFIVDWKGNRNEEGYSVTSVESIEDNQLKEHLRAKLMEEETIQQVNFL